MLGELLHSHLVRLAAWSITSLAVGLLGFLSKRDTGPRSFFGMTAGWALINLIIALASWNGAPPRDLGSFREFLFLNDGLNVAYIAVGVTMILLAAQRPPIKGAGLAVAIQGVGLLVLDSFLITQLSR